MDNEQGLMKCQLCGRYVTLNHTCVLCGKNVCPKCFRISMGVCKGCIPGKEKKYYDLLEKYY
ncbi:MAG: hypothetical protein ACE5HW_01580 [Candidatus Methanofastidiosia archaeon]